jgi:type IV secretory pathway VirB4 component
MLNASENFDFKNDKYIVFDLEAIESNKEVKGLVAILIINLVTKKTESVKGERVSFLIDEAIDFLAGDMGDYIGGAYRKIRKKNGEVIIATQGVTYLDSVDKLVRDSITGNTQTVMLLDHSSVKGQAYPKLQKYFSLTDSDLKLLDSIQVHHEKGYGEVFIKMGDLAKNFRLQVSDFAGSLYTTRKSEVEEINEIRERVGSLAGAINVYIDNKSKT